MSCSQRRWCSVRSDCFSFALIKRVFWQITFTSICRWLLHVCEWLVDYSFSCKASIFFGLEGQAEGQIAAEGSWDSRLPCELAMIFFLFPLDSRSLTEGVTSVVTTQPCFSARGQVPPSSPRPLILFPHSHRGWLQKRLGMLLLSHLLSVFFSEWRLHYCPETAKKGQLTRGTPCTVTPLLR